MLVIKKDNQYISGYNIDDEKFTFAYKFSWTKDISKACLFEEFQAILKSLIRHSNGSVIRVVNLSPAQCNLAELHIKNKTNQKIEVRKLAYIENDVLHIDSDLTLPQSAEDLEINIVFKED